MSLVYTVRPISDRTAFAGQHENSQFTATWLDTLDLLDRELWVLDAEHVVLEVDVAERAIRADGMLRADAKAASPAVRLAFDSRHGTLQYATDKFVRPSWRAVGAREDWQHNLRAIALGLEALRKVDRYGITRRGEQYAGWKALPAGGSIPMPSGAGALTVDEAARFLLEHSTTGTARSRGDLLDQRVVEEVLADGKLRRQLYREAAAALHPDRGGDVGLFHQLQSVRQLLDTPASATEAAGNS